MQDNVFVTLVVSVQYQVSKVGLEAVTLLALDHLLCSRRLPRQQRSVGYRYTVTHAGEDRGL